eukprot:28347-Karenia_brevis.AAC.1
MSILNRVIAWNHEGISYQADPRHAEIIIEHLGLKEAKIVQTPGVKEAKTVDGDEEKLGAAECTKYRAIAARANYLAQDRADIAFA